MEQFIERDDGGLDVEIEDDSDYPNSVCVVSVSTDDGTEAIHLTIHEAMKVAVRLNSIIGR